MLLTLAFLLASIASDPAPPSAITQQEIVDIQTLRGDALESALEAVELRQQADAKSKEASGTKAKFDQKMEEIRKAHKASADYNLSKDMKWIKAK